MRSITRRSALTIAAAAAVPAAVAIAATSKTTTKDPAVAAWRDLQRALRTVRETDAVATASFRMRPEPPRDTYYMSAAEHCAWQEACDRADAASGYDVAWERWSDACDVAYAKAKALISARPTTVRGLMAKVTAVRQMIDVDEDAFDLEAKALIASLQHVDPATLAPG